MSESVTQLKLYDLPKEINVSDLISVFKNKEKNGGGPIQEIMIHYSSEECYAIITFEETDAVSRILRRGKKVPILDFHVEVDIFNDKKCCCRESQNLKDQPDLNSRSIEEQNSEKILHEASFISLPEKMPEDVPIYEDTGNEIWNRTIKAHICDRKKSKKYYELFFDDIGLSSYEPYSMMLDGLHKFVYVTFKDIQEAQKLCQLPLDTEDCNISKVEMAKQKDFETYEDRLFLYSYDGLSLKDLPGFVTKKTGLDIKEVIQEDDKCAAIIVMDETDITPLTWDLTNLNGTRMITAPVYKEKSVLVAGLNSDVSKAHLDRYLKNKKHSGGGPVESVDLIDECQARVTFVDETDMETFAKKDKHELEEGCFLEVSRIYSCLAKSYIQKFVDEKLTKPPEKQKVSKMDSSVKKIKQKSSEVLPNKKNEHKSIEISLEKKTEEKLREICKKISLCVGEFTLLDRCDFFKKINKMCIQSHVDFEIENQTIILKGLESSVMNLELEILKKCKSDIRNINLLALTQEQIQILMIESIRERLNLLLSGGYLECSNNEIILFYLKSEDPYNLIKLLKTQICVEKKMLSSENVSALKSSKAREFLDNLRLSLESTNVQTFFYLDEKESYFLVMAPEKEIQNIIGLLDTFLLQNKFLFKTMTFPEGKQLFLNKYMHQEIAQLQNDKEIHLTTNQNTVTVTGISANVNYCNEKLCYLRDSILEDTLTLKYYGIKEYLLEQEAQRALNSIADKNKCFLTLKSEAVSLTDNGNNDTNESNASGGGIKQEKYFWDKKRIGTIEVILTEGEITNQKADVIVTTVDKSFDLTKGRMSRSVLEKAGDQIQQELMSKYRTRLSMFPGECIKTKGGNLSCQHIFFVCLARIKDPSNSSENKIALKSMQDLVDKILIEADKLKVQTISIPTLGTGRLGYSAEITAQATVNAINDFARFNSNSTLKSIQLVVYPTDKEVLKAFKNIVLSKGKMATSSNSVENIDPNKKEKFTSVSYGKVKFFITQGDITKEAQCEAIVNSIKDNMDLSKSGKVCQALLEACGRYLQEECSRKKSLMAVDGLVVTDAPNLICKKIIHISQDKFTRDWATGITKVLNEADSHGIKSLALPALGTGFRHANIKDIKKTMLECIRKFSEGRPRSLCLIKLVIFDKIILEEFLKNDQDLQSRQDAGLTLRKLSEEAVFSVYSDSYQNIEAAKREIKELVQEKYIDWTVDDLKFLHLVSKEHIGELTTFGLQKNIQVFVNEGKKQLQLYGFSKSAIDEVVSKVKNLLETAIGTAKVMNMKTKQPRIVWQFKRQGSWIDFEPLLDHQLEVNSMKGMHYFELTNALGEIFFVDLKQMKQHIKGQSNLSFDIRKITV
ncbi:uncharacterized protein LOC106074325 isoform X2 [Biomphalaria glabrata]|uniref:Uncharacterized protein LOC106074325 isoform X2 n=1 Tax=Biomphalaria glabrata TaxID=6526 RepID=A0A9W2ZGT2_BIOGL|nr:uncharacterized protein LOC106074325 isoform X2 [Biomphalaria glabrata]